MSVYQELYNKGWLGNSRVTNASASGVYGKMYSLINAGLLENTVETRNRYLRKAEYRNTDWFKELFQNTVYSSVSITSGTESPPTMRRSAPFSIRDGRRPARFPIIRPISMRRIISRTPLRSNLITNGSYRKQKAPGTLGATTDYVTGEVKRDFDINPIRMP